MEFYRAERSLVIMVLVAVLCSCGFDAVETGFAAEPVAEPEASRVDCIDRLHAHRFMVGVLEDKDWRQLAAHLISGGKIESQAEQILCEKIADYLTQQEEVNRRQVHRGYSFVNDRRQQYFVGAKRELLECESDLIFEWQPGGPGKGPVQLERFSEVERNYLKQVSREHRDGKYLCFKDEFFPWLENLIESDAQPHVDLCRAALKKIREDRVQQNRTFRLEPTQVCARRLATWLRLKYGTKPEVKWEWLQDDAFGYPEGASFGAYFLEYALDDSLVVHQDYLDNLKGWATSSGDRDHDLFLRHAEACSAVVLLFEKNAIQRPALACSENLAQELRVRFGQRSKVQLDWLNDLEVRFEGGEAFMQQAFLKMAVDRKLRHQGGEVKAQLKKWGSSLLDNDRRKSVLFAEYCNTALALLVKNGPTP